MASCNGVSSRTRSRHRSGSSEQCGFEYLCESSGKSNEHENDRNNRKRKNLSEVRKNRKRVNHSHGLEIDDEGFEIITEVEFRNTKKSNSAESIPRDDFQKCKRNDRAKGIRIEITDEDEVEHDHAEQVEIESSDEEGIEFRNTGRSDTAERTEIESITKDEFQKSKRNDHVKGIKMKIIEEDEFEHDHAERVEIGSNHEEGIELEITDETEFLSSTRRHNHAEEVVIEESCSEEQSSECSSENDESSSCFDSSDSSWSSYSESDDEDDEDFVIENSDCSRSMELSSSYVKEGDDHRDRSRISLNEFSDSNDEEACSRISRNAPSKVDEDEAIQILRKNDKITVRNVGVHSNVQECARNEEVIDMCPKTERPTRRHLHPRKSNDLRGKKMKPDETNDEDGDSMKFHTKEHPPRKKHVGNEEVIDGFEKNKDHDLCKNLLDAVLDKGAEFGDNKNHKHKNTLPLRFRFEDEVTRPVEKSEFEVMIGSLFQEMELCLRYGDMYQEVENDNANHPDTEMNQYALCCKGKHYLIQDDELGLICSYCLHVELEAKHVLPPWAEKMYRGADRRSSGASALEGLNLERDGNITGCCDLRTGTIWDIKPSIRESMYEHQRKGLEFLWKNLAGTTCLNELETSDSSSMGGCIISHAPGTGKTRLTMVFIETYLKVFPNCRPLIIAPASMLLTWEEEFRKWEVEFPFHNLNNLEMSGKENEVVLKNLQEGKSPNKDAARMIKIFSWNKERSILGMSYHLFELLAGKKSRSNPLQMILLEKTSLVVLDEGHTPRSQKSNIWNTLIELKTKKRIILSGTPFQNNFQELFNILRIVRPAIAEVLVKERIFAEMIMSRASRLRKKYENDNEEHQEIVKNRAIEELKATMAPFVHVHKGMILQESLPGLRDCVVLLKPPPLQKSLIKRIEGSKSTLEFDHKVALISVHPYLLKHCISTENERKEVDLAALERTKLNPTEGVKTRYIMELVRLSAVRDEKVLIFSQYIKPLALIQHHLEKIFHWTKGKNILKMEGKMGQKNRQDLINAFNDPKSEAKVLLASTKCCSEGINLVGASRVILLDVVWNPSVERQAISRAYRLGQKKIVYTYHLMTSGTTEGDKYCRQAEKERLSELVFTSSSNEKCRVKNSDIGIKDEILEEMVDNGSLKDMFEKIIYQPKEKNLMDAFSIAG